MCCRNVLILLFVCTLVSACQRSRVEPSTVSAPAPADSASNKTVLKPGPQPTDAELREAVKRNYQDAVTIDDSQPVPFLVGDFNGDRSEDIAIAVKPGRGKVSELNSEYVNWILEDPAQFPIPGHKNQRVTVGNNDLLLAVIHGEGREGWRSSLARQTYLLKNAVGANLSDGAIRWTGGRYLSHPGK